MITAGIPLSFKTELWSGVHDFVNDTFKLALYTSTAALSPTTTTAYTSAGEAAGGTYPPGGVVLTGATVTTDQGLAIVSFNDASFPGAVVTYAGALIYNASRSNRAVLILDFGPADGPETSPVVRMPSASAVTGLLRI